MEGIIQAILSVAKNILHPNIPRTDTVNQLVQSGWSQLTATTARTQTKDITFPTPFDSLSIPVVCTISGYKTVR